MSETIRAKMICRGCSRDLWWHEVHPGLVRVWPCNCTEIERDAEVGHKDARIGELLGRLRDQHVVISANAKLIRAMLRVTEKAGLAVDRDLIRSYEERMDAVMSTLEIDGHCAGVTDPVTAGGESRDCDAGSEGGKDER
jgi:hypothetical protein